MECMQAAPSRCVLFLFVVVVQSVSLDLPPGTPAVSSRNRALLASPTSEESSIHPGLFPCRGLGKPKKKKRPWNDNDDDDDDRINWDVCPRDRRGRKGKGKDKGLWWPSTGEEKEEQRLLLSWPDPPLQVQSLPGPEPPPASVPRFLTNRCGQAVSYTHLTLPTT